MSALQEHLVSATLAFLAVFGFVPYLVGYVHLSGYFGFFGLTVREVNVPELEIYVNSAYVLSRVAGSNLQGLLLGFLAILLLSTSLVGYAFSVGKAEAISKIFRVPPALIAAVMLFIFILSLTLTFNLIREVGAREARDWLESRRSYFVPIIVAPADNEAYVSRPEFLEMTTSEGNVLLYFGENTVYTVRLLDASRFAIVRTARSRLPVTIDVRSR